MFKEIPSPQVRVMSLEIPSSQLNLKINQYDILELIPNPASGHLSTQNTAAKPKKEMTRKGQGKGKREPFLSKETRIVYKKGTLEILIEPDSESEQDDPTEE